LILGFKNDEFIAKCSFEERGVLKGNGFQWDSEQKIWCTANPAVAAKLGAYAMVNIHVQPAILERQLRNMIQRKKTERH
jgi:hypothetical protein